MAKPYIRRVTIDGVTYHDVLHIGDRDWDEALDEAGQLQTHLSKQGLSLAKALVSSRDGVLVLFDERRYFDVYQLWGFYFATLGSTKHAQYTTAQCRTAQVLHTLGFGDELLIFNELRGDKLVTLKHQNFVAVLT